MPTPTFSVVIPTYNRAALLPKTLDTVFAQRYPAHEVLVIDNCSTDDTAALMAPLQAAGKLRYIRHDRNYERARSRNTGMAAATGDFVTFLDSDDLMYPQNLADAADLVQRHPSLRFFHNRYELVNTEGQVLHRYRQAHLDDPRQAIIEGNFLSCIGAFIHRDIYQHYRFDEDPGLTGSEDWFFWIKVVADHTPARIDRINNAIVQHGGRTVVTVDLPKVRRRLDLVEEKIRADPHLAQVYAPYLSRYRPSALLYAASLANSALLFREALGLLYEAVKLDRRILLWDRFLRVLRIAMFRINKGS